MVVKFEFLVFSAICAVANAGLLSSLHGTLKGLLDRAIQDVNIEIPVSGTNMSLAVDLNAVRGGIGMNILNSRQESNEALVMRGRKLQFLGHYEVHNECVLPNRITGGAFSFILENPVITITPRTATHTRQKRQSFPFPLPPGFEDYFSDYDFPDGLPPPPPPGPPSPPSPPPPPPAGPPSPPPSDSPSDPPSDSPSPPAPPSDSSSIFRFSPLSSDPSGPINGPPPSPPYPPPPGSSSVFRFSPLSSQINARSSSQSSFRFKREVNPPYGPPLTLLNNLRSNTQSNLQRRIVRFEHVSVTIQSQTTHIQLGAVNNGDMNLYNKINSYVNSKRDEISTTIKNEFAEVLRSQFQATFEGVGASS